MTHKSYPKIIQWYTSKTSFSKSISSHADSEVYLKPIAPYVTDQAACTVLVACGTEQKRRAGKREGGAQCWVQSRRYPHLEQQQNIPASVIGLAEETAYDPHGWSRLLGGYYIYPCDSTYRGRHVHVCGLAHMCFLSSSLSTISSCTGEVKGRWKRLEVWSVSHALRQYDTLTVWGCSVLNIVQDHSLILCEQSRVG